MTTWLVLLRGINVGGKNRVPMSALRELLESLGFSDVATYIASGNVILESDRPAAEIRATIEGGWRVSAASCRRPGASWPPVASTR